MKFYTLAVLASALGFSMAVGTSASATEPLMYKANPNTDSPDSFTAHIDLNGDGIDEGIHKLCKNNQRCLFTVTAKKNRQPIEIGHFSAFNVLVLDETTYGVRDLILYNAPANDYDYKRLKWSPDSFRYEER